jgi:hypothetical protein
MQTCTGQALDGVRFGLARRYSVVTRACMPDIGRAARRINPRQSPGRLMLAAAVRAARAGTTGQAGSPLMRFRPLQRMRLRRAVRAAMR